MNLVGILFEAGKQRFQKVHTDAAARIADTSQTTGVRQLVHVSAIGADIKSDALYAQTKGLGEAAVKKAFPGATILRPSVVFGPEDGFFNLFAGMSRLAPALPVFGCPAWPKVSVFSDKGLINFDFYGDGGTKFQPVYVGDVADAVIAAFRSPETAGKVYELGGPTVYSSKELMALMLRTTGRRRLLLPLPFWLLTTIGFFMEALPKPFITRDQVKLLRRDNVVARRAKKLQDLGIAPTAAESVLPTYLARFEFPGAIALISLRWSHRDWGINFFRDVIVLSIIFISSSTYKCGENLAQIPEGRQSIISPVKSARHAEPLAPSSAGETSGDQACPVRELLTDCTALFTRVFGNIVNNGCINSPETHSFSALGSARAGYGIPSHQINVRPRNLRFNEFL